MLSFPQELIDTIIAQIDLDDRTALETLSTCCTVARAFLPASRARLWNRLQINSFESYESLFKALAPDGGNLAPLVQTLAFRAVEELDDEGAGFELLSLFKNIRHVEFLEDLDALPVGVLELLARSCPISVVTFNRLTFWERDVCMDLCPFMTSLPKLCDIRFKSAHGLAPRVHDVEEYYGSKQRPIVHPEALSVDLSSFGVYMMDTFLSTSWFISLRRLKRLHVSFMTDEGDRTGSGQAEEMLHRMIRALPASLQEISFGHPKSIAVLRENAKVVPIEGIRSVAFDIVQNVLPLETIKWWTRNICHARETGKSAIRTIQIDIILDGAPTRKAVDSVPPTELTAPDMMAAWSALDVALSALKLEKLTVSVQVREYAQEDSDAFAFQSFLKSTLFPLCRQMPYFYLSDMRSIWIYL